MKEQFVKIFAETTMSQLEFSINNYLKNCPAKIISISYTTNSYVFKERAIVVFEKEEKNE